jgi:hypothetical protein
MELNSLDSYPQVIDFTVSQKGQESPFPAVDAKVRSSRKRTFLARAGNDWVSP